MYAIRADVSTTGHPDRLTKPSWGPVRSLYRAGPRTLEGSTVKAHASEVVLCLIVVDGFWSQSKLPDQRILPDESRQSCPETFLI